jgi:hypothetical protein
LLRFFIEENFLNSFNMASSDHSVPTSNGEHHSHTGDHSNQSTIHAPNTETKRKVSILTDPPAHDKVHAERHGGYYDNLAFEGAKRKISQVSEVKSRIVFVLSAKFEVISCLEFATF